MNTGQAASTLNNTTLNDLIAEALAEMQAAGLSFDTLEVNAGFRRKRGADHQWHIADSGIGRSGRPYLQVTAGNAKVTGDVATPTCVFKSWERNQYHATKEDVAEIHRQLEAAKQERKAEEKRKHRAAAKKASALWDHAEQAPGDHTYLVSKGVKAHGLRLYRGDLTIRDMPCDGELVVPVRIDGKLASLQFIDATGDKRFLPGGATAGGYCPIGSTPEGILYVAEGYATAATIHEVTGAPVTSAFNAGNLESVARARRKAHPELSIIIAGDNDQWTKGNPGVTKAKAAAEAVGGSVVVPKFSDTSTKPTDFNDLARLEGPDVVREQLRKAAAPTKRKADKLPSNFVMKKGGIWFVPPGGEEEPTWVCSELQITATTRDGNAESHGRLLVFRDIHGIEHQWPMPMEMLAGDGVEFRRSLLDKGLRIAHGRKARELLALYVQSAQPQERARCVDKTGWHDDVFVLPDEVIGTHESGERILLQSKYGEPLQFDVRGTPDEWRDNVAALCSGNSRLVLTVSLSFAAPLLDPAEGEPGGVHLMSESSTGKTTALYPALSVSGNPDTLKRTWRATGNGLEGVAAQHNDMLLCLDEMGQVDGREAGSIAYMLANGRGKTRGQRQGGARQALSWRLMFLSTGEISLSQHMSESGKRTRAGQALRVVDIPADAGVGFGLFENLHDYLDGAAFADALKAASRRFYGSPLQPYLEMLTNHKAAALEAVKATMAGFTAEAVPQTADGQVKRVAGRFALAAAGGELATTWGFTGWNSGDAVKAARTCFDAWLGYRGGHGPQEERDALTQVRHFLEVHGQSRFQDWEPRLDNQGQPIERNIINRAGFCREGTEGVEFYIFPEAFKRDVCEGLNPGFVARVLKDRGWLNSDKGKLQKTARLPGSAKAQKTYLLTESALGGEV